MYIIISHSLIYPNLHLLNICYMWALSETLEKQTWMRYCLYLQGSYSFSTEGAMQIKILGAVLEVRTVYYGTKGGCVRLFWKRVEIGFMMNGTLKHSPERYEIDKTCQL